MRIKLTERNMLIILIAVLGVLICLRAVSTLFLYPAFAIALLAFAFCPLKVCLPLLCFLLPFANIIKIQPGQISLFTVLFLIYVIRTIFREGHISRFFLIGVAFFAVYSFVFSGVGKAVTILTMVCGFAMVHDVCENEDYDYEEVLYSLCIGIIVSSLLALFKESLPILNGFILVNLQKVDHTEYVERFMGLNSNANYFAMDISVVLSCLVVKMCDIRLKMIHIMFFAILSVFGLMSVSKSFLITWIILLVTLVLFGLKNGGSSFLKILVVVVITGMMIYGFADVSIDAYLVRLEEDSVGDLSDITSGRSDIVVTYVKEIFGSTRTFLFGKGLGNIIPNYKGTHNTYMEGLYSMGVIGVVLYLFTLRTSITLKNLSKKVIYYVPIAVLLIRFMGIGMITHDSIWYYFVVICLMFKNNNDSKMSTSPKQFNI